MDIGESSVDNASAVEDGGTTVEIKIKTLDAQSYTLRVEKNASVPALKDQIASVVGVPVENQRLICRGKVLKDDQVLSAYNVEDGHTLHLVARQTPPPPPISTGQEAGTATTGPSDMVIVSPRNRSGHVSHSLLMGTINIPDTGEGGMPDLNRIISAVMNSVGIGIPVPSTATPGTGGTVTVVVPDALTTMSQYLDRLEQSFSLTEGGTGQNVEGTSVNEGASHPQSLSGQPSGSQTLEAGPPSALNGFLEGIPIPSSLPASSNERSDTDTGVSGGATAPARRSPTPQALGAIVQRVQNLLSGLAGSALARLATQLETEPSLLDPAARADVQSTAVRDGHMMQNLGALLLELGRTTLTLRMGQSPAESVVNAGPAVFISPSGPNPMMVQRPPPRAVAGVTPGAPGSNVRQVMERAEAGTAEHGLTVRQIIERAEAVSAAQQANAEMNNQAASVGPVQGAIMTFNENGAMRVVPVRSRPAAGAHINVTAGNPANDASATALLARFQQQLESLQQRPGPQSASADASSVGTHSSNQEPTVSLPPTSLQPIRAQVHVQSWPPTFIQGLEAGFPQPVLFSPATGEVLVQTQNQGAQPSTAGAHTGLNSDRLVTSQDLSGSEPVTATSSEHVDNQREMDVEMRRVIDSMARGQQHGHEIADSLGPLFNQLVAAFQHSRSPDDVLQPEQVIGQTSVAQANVGPEVSSRGPTTSAEGSQPRNLLSIERGVEVLPSAHIEHPESLADLHTVAKMDVLSGSDIASGSRGLNSVDTNQDFKLLEGSVEDTEERPPEVRNDQSQGTEEKSGNPPLGLGLGGLQPLPARARRRGQRQSQSANAGPAAVVGSGLSAPRGNEQTLAPSAAQNFLQRLVSRVDRPTETSDGNAMQQSVGQLTQGLFPLLGSLGNMGTSQNGEGSNLGDLMGQLMSRTDEGNAGQAPLSSSMLRGMMGQIVQSPFMENLVQQVMTRSEETQSSEQGFSGLSGDGGFDFAGVMQQMQQMLPVVTQMIGSRQTPSSGQEVPNALNAMLHNEEVAARGSPGQNNDTGRWREALSEEEAAQWSETITADVEQQQSAAPQRPFSDVYSRGSPVAKRQKTDLEGTAQKLENGGAPEDVLRSVAEDVAEQFVRTNGTVHGEASQLAQHVVETEGLAETPILAMVPDSRMQPESSNSRRRPRSQMEGDSDWLRLS
ncbi:large proline-rich protein BAG6 [Marchantia polymorpha subsp. ruderalis]